MSQAQIAVLVAAALVVFWMVGAYNRLVALRNAIGDAWKTVDDVLARRGAAIEPMVEALREPFAAEQGALDALLAAARQVRSAADTMASHPVKAERAAEVLAAEAQMASAASRVLALLEQQPALKASAGIAEHVAVLTESPQRLAFARQLFNDAAQVYNAAARQFPTRLLAQLYGFGTAGRL